MYWSADSSLHIYQESEINGFKIIPAYKGEGACIINRTPRYILKFMLIHANFIACFVNIVGIGKTTLVRKVCSLLQQREGIEVHGFYTEEVRERTSGGRGSRIGFDVVTLSGNRAPLARVGRWGMMHLSLSLTLPLTILS